MEFASQGPWLGDDGPESDVVISCRVRLARNLVGFPFVVRASDAQRRELVQLSREVVLQSDLSQEMIWVDLAESTARDRQLLVERHLISRHLAEAEIPRAVAVSAIAV